MKLPLAPQKYDQAVESQRNRELEQADEENQKRHADYDIESRLRRRDPDGIWWTICVDRAGQLYTKSEGAGILDEFLDSVTISASGTVS